jgi:site-specific DNA-methyltransferase (adenine-specific)
MKPYYKNELTTIYNGDCLDVMDYLIEQDIKVGAIITDPPYGINLTPQRKDSKFKDEKIVNDDNLDFMQPFLEKASKLTDTIYMFASWKKIGNIQPIFEKYFDYKNCLVWDKQWFGLGNNWRPQHEFILYGSKDNGVISSNSKSNILNFKKINGIDLVHSCEKPLSIMMELIEQTNGIILDCFSGSFATCIASEQLNRRSIGIELETKYCDVGVKRLSQLQMRLDI